MNIIIFIYLVTGFSSVFAEDNVLWQADPFLEQIGDQGEDFLPLEDLIDAALIASGSDDRELSEDRSSLAEWISEMEEILEPGLSDYDKGEAILSFMHSYGLSRYSLWQTKLTTLLDNGQFNCVSSAVLYQILARSQGLYPEGTGTADHAFCTLRIDGSTIDVETTLEQGFDPGRKQEFADAFGEVTGYTYVPPGNYSDRTILSERQLLGLILQNRIALLQRENRYEEALELALDRYALTRDETSRSDVIIGVQNQVSQLNTAREYAAGIEFIEQAQNQIDFAFTESLGILVYNYLIELSETDLDQAESLLERFRSRLDDSTLLSGETLLAERLISRSFEQENFEESLGRIEEAYSASAITAARYREFLAYLYTRKAIEIANTGDFFSAYQLLESVPEAIARNGNITRALETYRYNHTVEIYNQFVELAQSGRSEEAENLVRQGLKEVPDSRILQQALQQITP